MSKVKEISEEQYYTLRALGLPTCWDYTPFETLSLIRDWLEYLKEHTTTQRQRFDKERMENGDIKFYTLVEDSDEQSEDE